jgi:hypothetical protein
MREVEQAEAQGVQSTLSIQLSYTDHGTNPLARRSGSMGSSTGSTR